MVHISKLPSKDFSHRFFFESFGVKISIAANKAKILEQIKQTVQYNLLNHLKPIDENTAEHNFLFYRNPGNKDVIYKNGEKIAAQVTNENLIEIFGSIIRLTVAEFSNNRVFVHAGVVGWNEKALIIPAKSYQGKSMLTAAFVERGAIYYSDEYAIFDEKGFVYPFAKPISLRENLNDRQQTDYEIKEFGGTAGVKPIPVGMVLITDYKADAIWKPQKLSPANGIIELIKNTISIRQNPKFALKVLNQVGTHAHFIKSKRNDVGECADLILQLFENYYL